MATDSMSKDDTNATDETKTTDRTKAKDERIAAYRARYEALKANGRAPKSLPGPSARPAAPVADDALIHRETIPGGWYWSTALRTGEILRIETGETPSAVALVAWRAADRSERINYADTVKVQWTSALTKGRVIFSDMGRIMLSIVEDSCACHDAITGGSTARTNGRRFGDATLRNTRDNFVLAAQKLGMDARDVPPCISFFAPVRVDESGAFHWYGDRRTAADYVEVRAEMDLLVSLSNCPHPLDPASAYAPAPVEAIRYRGAPVAVDDLCRTATDEARRGFENNAALAL